MPKTSILIVEDETVISLHIQNILEEKGFIVAARLSSGENAAAKAEELKPDIILMDIKLQGEIDGITAIEEIKKKQDIPFIYMTAHSDEKTLGRAKSTGPYGYIMKPINPNELFSAIEIALYKHEMEMKLKESEKNLELAQQVAKIGSWKYNIKTGELYWSRELYNIYGLDPEKIKAGMEQAIGMIHPEDKKYADSALKDAINDCVPYVIEYRIIRTDGEVRYIQGIGRIEKDSTGKASIIYGTGQDITERKKNEESLHQYGHIVSNSSDMLALINSQFCYLAVNDAYSNAFNLTPDEFNGKSVSDIVGEETFTKTIKPNAVNCMKGEKINYQDWFNLPALGFCYMDVTYVPYYDKGDRIIGFVVNARDITDRKLFETSIIKEKNKLQKIMNTVEVIIVGLDLQGKITQINRKGCEILKYSEEELIGCDWFQKAIPKTEAAEKVKPVFDKIINGDIEDAVFFENHIKNAHGELRLISWHNSCLMDEDGRIIGTISTGEDITDIKLLEEELRKEEQLSETIIETAQTIILVLDKEGRIVTFNPYLEEISGYSVQEVKGKDWFSTFLPGRDHDRIRKLFKKAVNNIHTRGNVNSILTKDGSERIIEWYDKTLKDPEGHSIGVLATGQDITERKKAEEQLKESLHEKEILLKEIHHRVKNNMQVISSMLSLQKKFILNEKDQKIFTDCQNRVFSMAMVHEHLYQSENLSKIRFDNYITQLANYLFKIFRTDPAKVKLLISADNEFLEITQAIPGGMFLNELLSNSLKYAFPDGKDGEIRINFSRDINSRYTLVVADNGIGLPEGYDYKKSDTLGMRLANAFAEQLDGELELINTNGTKFVLTF